MCVWNVYISFKDAVSKIFIGFNWYIKQESVSRLVDGASSGLILV